MKIFIIILISFAALCSRPVNAQIPTWKWAVQSDGPKLSNAAPDGICIDRDGNIYVAATFNNTIIIGDTVFYSSKYNTLLLNDFILIKYNSDGKILWVRHPEGPVSGVSIALDSAGNCFVSAYTGDLLDFGNYIVYAFPGAFVAKYDSKGNILWAEQVLNHNGLSIQSLATDKLNNFYLTGNFGGIIDTLGITLNRDSTAGFLLAKFNSDGQLQWAKQPLFVKQKSYDLDSDRDGNNPYIGAMLSVSKDTDNIVIYVSGITYADTIFYGKNFITGMGVTQPTYQAFLARLNARGDCQWAVNVDQHRQYYASGSAYSVCVSTDNQDVLITGNFIIDTTNLSDTLIDAYGGGSGTYKSYTFAAKYDSLGTLQWLRKLENLASYHTFGSDNDFDDEFKEILGSNICVDSEGNSFLGGNFFGAANFNGIIINSLDSIYEKADVRNEFVMKFDKDGNTPWVKYSRRMGFGSIRGNYGYEALYGNNIYVTGSFINKTVDFGTSHLARNDSAFNDATLFLAKLSAPVVGDNGAVKITSEQNLFSLFPNPACSQATITFSLAKPGNVTIEIYDLLGRAVKLISLYEVGVGEHSQTLDLHGLVNGTYVCKVTAGGVVSSEIFTIVK